MASKHGTYARYSNGRCRCDLCKSAARKYRTDRAEMASAHGEHGTHANYVAGCRCADCSQANRQFLEQSSKFHGTNTGYTRGCRCERCKDARREYFAKYGENLGEDFPHGTWVRYSAGKCRCADCKSAGKFYNILRKFGLDENDYISLVEAQNGRCAICLETPTNSRGFHVDHDHSTGKVRGLLCHSCNVALGHVKDDVDRLSRMIDYLNSQS